MAATPPDKVLDALRASLKETERLRRRNRQLTAASWAPIAIVGMACRYPGGVNTPDELWDLVSSGGDAISEFPDDRGWEAVVAGTEVGYIQSGGFVKDAPRFDSAFFGISPREALAMDPQQRMLLEVAWETLEHAGIDPADLRGSKTGVFAGGTNSGYGVSVAGIEGTDGYMLTGGLTAVISGRISYTLGLEGPAVTVDTACSSALVALHLACQSLRSDECSMALAGAVTVLANPDSFADFAEQGGLAADGRCKAFAGSADGVGWSEGAGMFLLERLSDARRNGHQVLAVIRGSAVNQDGASNGLSAPNGPAQQRVIRSALSNARLSPAEVDVVEAHGTGTVLGDPIEAQAILATYGRDRGPDRPLWLGSVKSNLGHTGAAAGAAGLIKMVQALRHQHLPRTLHVDEPTPRVDWTVGDVRLLTEPRPWEPGDGVRRAGISAFGISGTNAHLIVEEAPAAESPVEEVDETGGPDAPEAEAPKPKVLTPGSCAAWSISARTSAGLAAQATRLAGYVAGATDLDPADVGWSLTTTRSVFEHRAIVIGSDRDELAAGLSALAAGEPAAGVVSGAVPVGGSAGRKVFVFPGQGGQWVGMGRELAASSPVFAARLAECGEALAPFVDWNLDEVLTGGEEISRLDVLHPVLWAIMVSLAAVWEAAGVKPDAVIGHSQGEIAAAVVAGILTLEDGARVVARRGQAMAAGMAGRGGVLSIIAPLDAVEARLRDGLAIATVNGPEAITVSGPVETLQGLAAECERDGVRSRFVPMDYAPHGPQVEAIRDEVLASLDGVTPGAAVIPMVSGMTADYLDGLSADAEYWYASLRATVQFSAGIERLHADGYGVFIEVSPHPVLASAIGATLEESQPAVVTGTLRRDDGGPARLLASFAEVHVHGVPVDWSAILPAGRRVDLPTYAFQRQRYWPSSLAGGVGDLRSIGLNSIGHPLLGAAVELADGEALVLTGSLSARSQPWLGEHMVLGGTAIFPGTGFVELAVVAGHLVGCTRIEELALAAPLLLPQDEDVQIQVTLSGPDEGGLRDVEIFARPADVGGDWTRHASGRLSVIAPADNSTGDFAIWPPEAAESISLDDLAEVGPTFRGLNAVWRRGDDVFAEVALPEQSVAGAAAFGLHPAVLDAALQAVAGPGIPFLWSDVSLYAAGATMLRARLRQSPNGNVSLLAVDGAGAPVISIGSLELRELDTSSIQASDNALRDALFAVQWIPVPVSAAPVGRWGVIGADTLGLADADVELSIYPGLAELAAAAESGDVVPEVVLLVLESADADPASAARRLAIEALEAVQHWLAADQLLEARLVVVTRNAVSALPGEDVTDLAASAIWGLLRSAQSENPGRIVLVDLPADDVAVGVLAGALGSAEPELAIREQRAHGRRLVRPAAPTSPTEPTQHVPGTVLITGGTGTLAGLTARHLVTTNRARNVLLVSRSGPSAAGAATTAADLAAAGADVQITAADVTDRAAVAALLATIPEHHPLTGVVHTAGIIDDGVIGSLTPERVNAVMLPKTDPAWILHQLTADHDLDLFVLFSSAAATFGGPGQGNYTAGNAFLDALAAHRRAHGLSGLSLAWGSWIAGAGIGRNLSKGHLARATGGGATELGADEGLALLEASLNRDDALLVPFRLDVAGLRTAAARGGALPPLLHALAGPIRPGVASAVNTGAGSSALHQQLARMSQAERDRTLTQLVRTHVAAVLGHASADEIEPDRAFAELGFDSLTAVELRNRLNSATGLRLATTLVFDYPAPRALARHLGEQLSGIGSTAAQTTIAAVTGDPIAIVGMGCRFPGGVESPAGLWRMLSDATDTISRFPADRGWDIAALYDPDRDNLGTSYTEEGGFLDGIAEFDPAFFRISPREAVAMDPQQRLLLETSWEALEYAGIDPTSLRGSMTGIYVGAAASGYTALGATGDGAEGHLLTGNIPSVISGRVSYPLGLEGPAVTVDTACSSSLVAMHLAAAALRTGECSLALAGGVMVMVDPAEFLSFSQQGALAVDGRSKAFSADADGMGLGEGTGMVVLERLSDARRNGHPVLAVIAGSAINQDGASNGLTAPNGPSQQRVIRAALAGAGLSAADIDAVEAHGTGTTLGDPIEAQALLATYGQDRPADRPLWLGSVKSNIGHAQQAAGVAGVMKMVLALQHGELPVTLHAAEPSTHIDWSMGDVRLLTEPVPWPVGDRPRRAGISSFGISGTNAHLIIQDAPAALALTDTPASPKPAVFNEDAGTAWLVSARTPAALAAQAERLADHVGENPELQPDDVAWSLAATRAAFGHRAVAVGGTRDELLGGSLSALAAGQPATGLVTGVAADPQPIVFVFPGQGSQWAGMGRDLARTSPVFAARLAECEQALAPYVDWSLTDVLAGAEGAPDFDRVDVVQPALWAVMVSLAAVWQAAGVRPDAVVGHSQGEIAAAVVAEILSLEDAAKVVALRSKALIALSGRGGMLAVSGPLERVEARLTSRADRVAIAAVNGPTATVVSGDPDALAELTAECERDGVRARILPVDYASHGPQVDEIRDEVLSLLAGISPRTAALPMVSAMTGEQLAGPEADAEYWYASLRASVRFDRAIRVLSEGRYGVFIEVSAHPVLTTAIGATLEESQPTVVAGTLRRDDGDADRMLASLAEVYVRGVDVDWPGVLAGGTRVDLPTYAFQHERFWPLPSAAGAGDLRSAGLDSIGHPLLGAAVELADGDGLVITGRLSIRSQPWLGDHVLGGTAFFPGTGYVELAVVAGHLVGCARIDELTLAAPLILPPDQEIQVQVTVGGPDHDGLRDVEIFARLQDSGDAWTRHASGRVGAASAGTDVDTTDFEVWPPEGAEPFAVDGFYDALAAAGQGFGPAFRGLGAAWQRGDEDVFAEVALQDAQGGAAYGLHPAVLDSALQAAWLTQTSDADTAGPRMPFLWSDVSLYAAGATMLRARLRKDTNGKVSLLAVDGAGTPVVSVGSLVLRSVAATPTSAGHALRDALFGVEWTQLPRTKSTVETGRCAVVGTDWLGLTENLAAAGMDAVAYPDLSTTSIDVLPDLLLTAVGINGLGAFGDLDHGQAARRLTSDVLVLLQQWLALESAADSRLVVITRGAVAALPGEGVVDLAAAAARGLLRSAQSENPGRIVLVDLPDPHDAEDAPDLISALTAALTSGEPEVAVRGEHVYGRRLVRPAGLLDTVDPSTAEPDPAAERVPGTVLITGGTGTLAALTARHLAATGRAARLLLVSRSGPAARSVPAVAAAVAEAGAAVHVVAADVTDRAAMSGLLAALPETSPLLTGIVHTAGIVDDGLISSLTPEKVDAVLRPKTDAAWILHELTADLNLDLFVMFSSAAATFGSAGQGNYVAGNAFLDALAAHRRAAGLKGLSLAWGAWVAGDGIGRNLSAGLLARATGSGSAELGIDEGLAVLDVALARDEALLVPFRLDVAGLRAVAARGGSLPPLLHALSGPIRSGVTSAVNAAGAGSSALRQQLARVPVAERDRMLIQLVRTHVAAVLGHASPDGVEPGRAFNDLGFDSLTAVELRNRLNEATGLRLPATLVFDYPSTTVLAGHLAAELLGTLVEDESVPAVTISAFAAGEPIAIVGMGCRFPGGIHDPEGLWELLAEGKDAITHLPEDRGWNLEALYDPDPDKAGTSYARSGGFVHDAAEFDPGFFGISPREAHAMDPQQRLLLEISWEALERAGIDPVSLRGSRTGVFAGGSSWGYGASGGGGSEGHLMTGASTSVISGRVSYTLGLEGPAVTVDTACSSSLVAMHLAAQALRAGECSLALAGGVTIMATPGALVGFSRQRGLAEDGRCKAFSASADGMGMAEGAGMLLLERLSDARRNGHRVLAVMRGSAVNQDGASNGLTAPNGPSQQRVIRAALANAQLKSHDIDVVEAHGTGTTLGDPIEAQALLATYGKDRPEDRPLWLGSVKSNLGHTQSAAGAAGVMKMILALQHGELPRSLYADQPAENIDWSTGDVRLLAEAQPWSANGQVRRAGVSSFGISGTNAHVILEEAPSVEPSGPPSEPSVLSDGAAWLVSGRTAASLAGQAGRLAEFIQTGEAADDADIAWSLATSRSTFEHRAVVLGRDRAELLSGLTAVAGSQPSSQAVTGTVPAGGGGGRVVFVFPGQGSQWVGMGRELAASSPVFASRLAECAEALAPYVDWSLDDVLAGDEGAPGFERVDVVQPVLWAVMVSLAAFWEAAGVIPDAVLGHSQGEIAAAVVAGILSLEDAAKVVALRSKALIALSGRGGMLSIAESAEAVANRITAYDDRIAIAAVNGPAATVVSGEPEALAELLAACEREDVRARMLPVDYASHGPQVEELRDEILSLLASVTPRPGVIPMVSALTGEYLQGPELDAEYWYASLRGTVEFSRAVDVLGSAGYGVFIETSAHPVLTSAISDTLDDAVVTGTLRRDDGGSARILMSLAEVHVRGVAVNWSAVLPAARKIALPTYAFQHERYWYKSALSGAGDMSSAGLDAIGHPLLGAAVTLAGAEGLVITGRLSAAEQPWLTEPTAAATLLTELAIVAGHQVGCPHIAQLTLAETTLVIEAGNPLRVQVAIGDADEDGLRTVEIYASRGDFDEPWTRYAQGRLAQDRPAEAALSAGFATWPPSINNGAVEIVGADDAANTGGPIRSVWRDGNELLAELALPEDGGTANAATTFGLHPALSAGLLDVVALAGDSGWWTGAAADEVLLPSEWTGMNLYAAGASTLRVRLAHTGAESLSLVAVDATGTPVLSVDSVTLHAVPAAKLRTGAGRLRDAMFRVDWVPVPIPVAASAGRWAVIGQDHLNFAASLAAAGVDIEAHTDLATLVETIEPDRPTPELVLAYIGDPTQSSDADDDDTPQAARRATIDVLELVKRWLALDVLDEARLVLVSSGAVAARPGDAVTSLPAAAAWGLVRSAQSENPGRLILADLPTTASVAGDEAISVLAAALGAGEPEVVIRDGRGLGRRLVRPTIAPATPTTPQPRDKATGTVLITGGTGTLAGLVAKHLVVTTGRARNLLLAGRRGPLAAGAAQLAAGLAEVGADVRIVACDVADSSAVANLLARVRLTGVVHTAGVLDDGVITSLTAERVDAVMRPKADAAWNLHRLTADLDYDLDFFALFSSAAATFGAGGQGNYAAGNAFLDALAAHRRSLGLSAVSLAWGLWADASGLTSHLSDGDRDRMSRGGVAAMPAEEGLALLDLALTATLDDALLVPARLNVAGLRAQVAQAGTNALVPPLLRILSGGSNRAVAADAAGSDSAGDALRAQLAGLSPAEADRTLTDLIRAHAAAVLGHAPNELIDDRRAFRDVGFDSLTAVELRNRLASATGLKLPATLIFDYPAPATLSDYLRSELQRQGRPGTNKTAGPELPAVTSAAPDEPIAIVGIGCRFPGGADSPERFWELLRTGSDAISGFPTDRGWDDRTVYAADGSSTTRLGGFLYDAGEFDPGFFGISPREAIAMDPQQRLLLETSWEALERAGIDPLTLRGSQTGVFAGGYGGTWYGIGQEGYGITGSAGSVISGRVSYALGLEGPAVTVDTACSSSLVAIHLACQALRAGECTFALAGGATVMATPGLFTEFSKQGGLASDGRCKSFGADADGTGWGEGAGILLLERLSDAQRNGHRVLAVVRGSAVNQDGASNGLTAPNGPSQQRVIRAALANARLRPGDVDAVEAHGTGTVLGDPIEAQALLATYGSDRPEGQPVWLGSVKSNIAHTGAAAGVAGVIKMVLALENELLPRTLHADEASPHVDWDLGEARLLTESKPWPVMDDRPRRAGISAFGISGTNAHLIVEEAPSEPTNTPPECRPEPKVLRDAPLAWLVSAKTASALSAQAGRLAAWARGGEDIDPADVAWSLATTRSVFEHRAVLLGADADELRAGSAALAAGESAANVLVGEVPATRGRVGFLFAGQGSQRAGMGRELYAASPVFAAAFDQAITAVEAELGLEIRDVVLGDSDTGDRADQTLYAQTGLFALEVGLLAVLAAAGIVPDAVAGHSVGEIAASYAAAVLSLEDACRLVATRARLMQDLPTGGAMAAIAASEAEILAELGDVSVAAVNGPTSVVVSGDEAAVDKLVELWRERGRRVRRLRVSHAFHSALMDPVLAELADVAGAVKYRTPKVTWVGALTGEIVTDPGSEYWPAQARQAVRFADAVEAMAELGVSTFIEIGPDGTLSALGSNALADYHHDDAADFIPMLRPKTTAATSVLTALGRAHLRGVDVDWTAVLPTGRRVDLPTYAFSRKRYWAEAPTLPAATTDGGGTPAEAQFWAAIEQGDLVGLSGALEVDGERPFSEVVPLLASWRSRDRAESAVADLRYRVSWTPVAAPESIALAGTWLVVTGSEGLAAAGECVKALSIAGADAVLVPVGAATDRNTLAARMSEAVTDQQAAGVLSLLAFDEAPSVDNPEVPIGLTATLGLVQALGDVSINAPLWLLTRGAITTGTHEFLSSPIQAQAWGLGRVVGLEHPDRWGGLIDLPPVLDDRAAARLTGVLAGCGEDNVALRAAGISGRRLVRAPRPLGAAHAAGLPGSPVGQRFAHGTVLVTGGTGAIGGHVADWLGEQGTARVALCSRSGPAARGVVQRAARLAESGTAVAVLAGDVARRADVAGLLDWLASDGPALAGVMHTAGIVDDGVLDGLSDSRLAGVLAPKAGGAAHLDELTADLELAAFVLFSSATAVFGGGGQGAYAAANAYLDALAEHRRGRGLAATSIQWGVWAGGGMAEADTTVRQRLVRGPLRPMDPRLAVRALSRSLESGDVVLGVMDVDWVQSAAGMGDPRHVPLLRELPDVLALVPTAAAGAEPVALGELITRLAAQPPAEQDRILTDLVRAEVAAVLGHESADAVGAGQAFQDLGFDSLTAVELRNRLSMATGERLPATLIFDYPTPAGLARFLKSELLPTLAEPGAADGEEAEVRKLLSDLPLSLLRSAGLLDSLLALARTEDGAPEPDGGETVSIEDLDVADLLRIARDRSGSEDF